MKFMPFRYRSFAPEAGSREAHARQVAWANDLLRFRDGWLWAETGGNCAACCANKVPDDRQKLFITRQHIFPVGLCTPRGKNARNKNYSPRDKHLAPDLDEDDATHSAFSDRSRFPQLSKWVRSIQCNIKHAGQSYTIINEDLPSNVALACEMHNSLMDRPFNNLKSLLFPRNRNRTRPPDISNPDESIDYDNYIADRISLQYGWKRLGATTWVPPVSDVSAIRTYNSGFVGLGERYARLARHYQLTGREDELDVNRDRLRSTARFRIDKRFADQLSRMDIADRHRIIQVIRGMLEFKVNSILGGDWLKRVTQIFRSKSTRRSGSRTTRRHPTSSEFKRLIIEGSVDELHDVTLHCLMILHALYSFEIASTPLLLRAQTVSDLTRSHRGFLERIPDILDHVTGSAYWPFHRFRRGSRGSPFKNTADMIEFVFPRQLLQSSIGHGTRRHFYAIAEYAVSPPRANSDETVSLCNNTADELQSAIHDFFGIVRERLSNVFET